MVYTKRTCGFRSLLYLAFRKPQTGKICAMSHDWLLVETLGSEPVVVADGRQTKNLIPISVFLRRSPDLMAIQTAISEAVRAGEAMSTITPRNDRVIRTEPVVMSDGRVHGVHVWIGPLDMEPPERLIPGPLKWDLTAGVATDTPESIYNSGRDPSTEATHGRTFAEDLPMRALNAERDQGALDGDQGRARHEDVQHVDRHRPQGRNDLRRLRRPREPGDARRRQRTAHLSRHELAGRTRRSVAAARSPRATHPRRAGAPWRAPRAGRPGQLDTAEMARRARAVLRLARARGGAASRSIPPTRCTWRG